MDGEGQSSVESVQRCKFTALKKGTRELQTTLEDQEGYVELSKDNTGELPQTFETTHPLQGNSLF